MDNLPFLKEWKYFCKSVHVSSAYPLSSHIPRAGNMLFSAYYKYIIIRNREYLFLCNSNYPFYENFQKVNKGALIGLLFESKSQPLWTCKYHKPDGRKMQAPCINLYTSDGGAQVKGSPVEDHVVKSEFFHDLLSFGFSILILQESGK